MHINKMQLLQWSIILFEKKLIYLIMNERLIIIYLLVNIILFNIYNNSFFFFKNI